MTIADDNTPESMQNKLLAETARISWRELQRFFAAGRAIAVAPELDLTEVAATVAEDQSQRFSAWMQTGAVGLVKDEQAQQWWEEDALVWAVVVAPWVLVQAIVTH